MKKIVIMIAAAAALFSACKSDPALFPDPGIDQYTPLEITIARDTTDHYTLKMRVATEAGIAQMRILNGYTYDVLQELDEYTGKKVIDFEHSFNFGDLPDRDTTLAYIIQVKGNDERGSNKTLKMHVLKTSSPTIEFLSDSYGTSSHVCILDCKVATGGHTIKEINVYMDDELVYTEVDPVGEMKDLDGNIIMGPLHEYTPRCIWGHEYIGETTYDVRVEVTDNIGQVGVANTVFRDLGKPRKLVRFVSGTITWHIDRDDQDRINYLVGLYNTNSDINYYNGRIWAYLIRFFWYEEGPHKGKMKRLEYCNGSLLNHCYFDFTYDENGHLNDFGQWRLYPANLGVKSYGSFSNIKYRENGTISEYTCNGTVRAHVPYADDFVGGEPFGTEYSQAGNRMNQLQSARRKYDAFVPVNNPMYVPGIPTIVDFEWCGTMLSFTKSPYMYSRISPITEAGNTSPESNVAYTLNDEGFIKIFDHRSYYYEGDDLPVHEAPSANQIWYVDYDRDGKPVVSATPLDYHWEHHADSK